MKSKINNHKLVKQDIITPGRTGENGTNHKDSCSEVTILPPGACKHLDLSGLCCVINYFINFNFTKMIKVLEKCGMIIQLYTRWTVTSASDILWAGALDTFFSFTLVLLQTKYISQYKVTKSAGCQTMLLTVIVAGCLKTLMC